MEEKQNIYLEKCPYCNTTINIMEEDLRDDIIFEGKLLLVTTTCKYCDSKIDIHSCEL